MGITDYTLHFRRSLTSGQSWGSDDLLTVRNATNPGIAITHDGKVGLIYQQLLPRLSAASVWQTHFRFEAASSIPRSAFTDDVLSEFSDDDLGTGPFNPKLGDYLRIQAVGSTFYGVFPAGNRPVDANFPRRVTYQRNADFTTNQLRDITHTTNIAVSVDPFFFKISPQIVLNFCATHPEVCGLIHRIRNIITIPRYKCERCSPNPCLSCPYEFSFNEIYQNIAGTKEKIVLTNPYFPLVLKDYDPKNFDIKITTKNGEPITQELNKTADGYAISFHPSKNNYSVKQGLHDLDISITAKSLKAAEKGAQFNYLLHESNYRFKEFMAFRR